MSTQNLKLNPFLRWAGGKRRLTSRIISKLPEKIETYYEPFLGGGAVFFELARQKRFNRAVLGDSCPELINAFQIVRDNVDELIESLRQPQYRYNRESFLSVRELNYDKLDPVARAARTIYLNKTCFNGLYRVNGKGKFNTPFGKYEDPIICNESDLRACSESLQSVELAECDFEDLCSDATDGDAIYHDPPYLPISGTAKFTEYTSNGFSIEDHKRLARLFVHLDEIGVAQVLSNSSSAKENGLFDKFEIEILSGARSIGRPDKRASVPEILVNNTKNWKMP